MKEIKSRIKGFCLALIFLLILDNKINAQAYVNSYHGYFTNEYRQLIDSSDALSLDTMAFIVTLNMDSVETYDLITLELVDSINNPLFGTRVNLKPDTLGILQHYKDGIPLGEYFNPHIYKIILTSLNQSMVKGCNIYARRKPQDNQPDNDWQIDDGKFIIYQKVIE